MTSCSASPPDKKAYGKEVGEILVRDHGKKSFYSIDQVKNALSQSAYGMDWSCWAFCLYTSASDFKAYHDSIGETCDYASMKSEMTSAITGGASDSWFDLDLSWLEWPDIELSSIFDFLD
jgi:hypothetical protein